MKLFQQTQSKLRRQSALTLVEMMVATTLLVVMMLGLTAMFNQTQRAFLGGLKQVDVFEGGRAVMDIVSRDIEQMAASDDANYFSVYGGLPLFAGNPVNNFLVQNTQQTARTNVLHSVYLLNHANAWRALGYRVLDSDTNKFDSYDALKVGTLYRFAGTNDFADFVSASQDYYNHFLYKTPKFLYDEGYLTRVTDGVVHFRLQFYDTAGRLISSTNNPNTNSIFIGPEIMPHEWVTQFRDVVPATVEVELGILAPQILKQAQSLPDAARIAYLEKQAGKVHIFRQQIPIRNAPR